MFVCYLYSLCFCVFFLADVLVSFARFVVLFLNLKGNILGLVWDGWGVGSGSFCSNVGVMSG